MLVCQTGATLLSICLLKRVPLHDVAVFCIQAFMVLSSGPQ